jgi:hypothetical protein
VKRFLGASVIALSMVVCSVGTAVASGGNNAHPAHIAGSGPDNGTCANSWADDTYKLNVTVRDNGDGTFAVRSEYRDAKFVTRSGASPGACQAELPHGALVLGGIKGKFDAWVEETITSGSYDADACGKKKSGTCTTRGGFVAASFGCIEDACASDWSWDFRYSSNDKRLVHDSWRDAYPALLPNEYEGDIATS